MKLGKPFKFNNNFCFLYLDTVCLLHRIPPWKIAGRTGNRSQRAAVAGVAKGPWLGAALAHPTRLDRGGLSGQQCRVVVDRGDGGIGIAMMALAVQVFWSFRSPYSYIATPRLVALARDFAVDIDLRIVHPAAIRNPDYFRHMNPLARPYFVIDSARAAAFHNLPFRRPVPDPIAQDMTTLEIAAEHPLAVRLGRLGVAAVEAGRGLAFIDEVSRLLWDGGTDNWHQGNHMAQATGRAGLDLAVLESAIADDPDRYESALAANDADLRKAGHWGVPTFVFEGEPFFGQDRFEVLLRCMQQRGLKKRS